MEKTIKNKVKECEEYLKNENTADKKEFLAYMTRWIGYFQHERLVHLIVTLFFALFSMGMLIFFMTTANLTIGFLFLIFMVTTCFYIRHYYILENKTQYLYELYDKIERL